MLQGEKTGHGGKVEIARRSTRYASVFPASSAPTHAGPVSERTLLRRRLGLSSRGRRKTNKKALEEEGWFHHLEFG